MHFRQAPFRYTLKPKPLEGDRIDSFLFDTQSGFCEYFASSYAWMMRLGGVPARVIGGYQGGEAHPGGAYWIVRQYDAHAWVEIWIEGGGWVRIDPTAAVDPSRIDMSFDQGYRASAGLGLISGLSRDHWLNQLGNSASLWADNIRYSWQQHVLGYHESVQDAFYKNWVGTPGYKWLWAGAVLVGLAGLMWLWSRVGGWRVRLDPHERLLRKILRRAARAGYPRAHSETLRAYLLRLQTRGVIASGDALALRMNYEALAYNRLNADDPLTKGQLERLARLKRVKFH
jgi:hypothetical protein